jgi:hypothetical protein
VSLPEARSSANAASIVSLATCSIVLHVTQRIVLWKYVATTRRDGAAETGAGASGAGSVDAEASTAATGVSEGADGAPAPVTADAGVEALALRAPCDARSG